MRINIWIIFLLLTISIFDGLDVYAQKRLIYYEPQKGGQIRW